MDPFSGQNGIHFRAKNGIESTQFHLTATENSIFVSLRAINGFNIAMRQAEGGTEEPCFVGEMSLVS